MAGIERSCVMLVVLVLLAAGACQSQAPMGASCARSSECSAPLVCRFGRCRTECATSRDCSPGLACIRDGSAGVCRLGSETGCTADSECGGALVCAGATCRNRCRDASDCAEGAVCRADAVAGTVCIETIEGVDAGAPSDAAPEASIPQGELVLVVASDADDGEIEPSGGLWPMGEGFTDYAGAVTTAPTRVFFRFTVTRAIPATATITDARLELWGTELYDSAGACQPTFRIGVVADDVADAVQVTSVDQWPGGPSGPPSTSAPVSWSFVDSWQVGARNVSPDLAPILRELVAHHGGLALGAHVQLWSWAENYLAECAAGSEDFASIASHPAELRIHLAP